MLQYKKCSKTVIIPETVIISVTVLQMINSIVSLITDFFPLHCHRGRLFP